MDRLKRTIEIEDELAQMWQAYTNDIKGGSDEGKDHDPV